MNLPLFGFIITLAGADRNGQGMAIERERKRKKRDKSACQICAFFERKKEKGGHQHTYNIYKR